MLEKLGIMTADGKIISQPQYSYIGNFSSGLAPVAIYGSGESPYFYVNTKGQPVFNYKFRRSISFYKGYALILSSGEYYLIDTKGNKVLTFPENEGYKAEIISHPTAHYNINGQYYDYKGNPVKL